jgi:hypothetical protein
MNVRIQPPLRNSLAVCLCLAAALLAAGCAVAPPGATHNSSAVGPPRQPGSTDFAPFPVPAVYNGLGNSVYTMVQKAKTGGVPGSFHFTVKPSMVFWLNCIGKGTAQLSSPGIGLQWSVPCGDGTSPGGITFRPKASAVGHVASVLVTVTRQSRWEIRIDAAAPKGVNPAPEKIPSRVRSTAAATAAG